MDEISTPMRDCNAVSRLECTYFTDLAAEEASLHATVRGYIETPEQDADVPRSPDLSLIYASLPSRPLRSSLIL